jgi:hypothetical protein
MREQAVRRWFLPALDAGGLSRQAATTASEPRSQHGVVVQSLQKILADRAQVEHE